MLRLLLLSVLGFWAVAARPLAADASSGGGRLEGTVVDPRGGPLAERAVTARNLATGIVRQQPSDPRGRFVFQDLPPGAYELTITATRYWVFTYAGATTSLLATRTEGIFKTSEQLPDVPVTPEAPLKGTLGRASLQGGAGNDIFVVPARAFDAEPSASALVSSPATENRNQEFQLDPSGSRSHPESSGNGRAMLPDGGPRYDPSRRRALFGGTLFRFVSPEERSPRAFQEGPARAAATGRPPAFLGQPPALAYETTASSYPTNLAESGALLTPRGAFGTNGTIRLTTSLRRFTGPELYPLPSPPDLPPPTGPASGEEVEATIDLLVRVGTLLRVALDERVTLRRVGQPVLGTLIEPVYSYDRVVLAAGTKVIGHVEKLERVPGATRLRAILRGDLTPLRRAILRFDTLISGDCTEIPVLTQVDAGFENVSLEVAAASPKTGKLAQARQEIAQRMAQMAAPLKGPDKMERLKELLTNRLPYHAQYLHRGTVYAAEVLVPLNFGTVTPVPQAAPGTSAPPRERPRGPTGDPSRLGQDSPGDADPSGYHPAPVFVGSAPDPSRRRRAPGRGYLR
jgi:hypothetical protein